jgi:type VI secretion system protein ImpH
LLPSGKAFATLVRMTKFLAGPEFEFNVNLALKAPEVPPCRLRESDAYVPRLGWTTWLSSTPRTTDAEDVMFSGEFSSNRAAAA